MKLGRIQRRREHVAPAIVVLALCGVVRLAAAQGTPDILWEVDGHDDTVQGIDFSPDGRRLATGADYWDNTVKVWNAGDGTLSQTLPQDGIGVQSVAFCPDEQHLAAGYLVNGYPPGGRNDLWDLGAEEVMDSFGGFFVAFSADGTILASGAPSRYVNTYQLPGGQQLAAIYTGSYVQDVACSPAEDIVAAAGADNTVKLYNAQTGEWLRTLSGHTDNVSTIAFSPDGEIIASGAGGFDDTHEASIKLWRVSDGELLRTLDGHDDWVFDLAFSPDGEMLISQGRGGYPPSTHVTIKLWDISNGDLLRYYDQDVTGYAVDFSPNGRLFAYGRIHGTVTVAHNPFAPAGDVNGDGLVNTEDLLLLLAAWGECPGGGDPCPADLNGDGFVDTADLLLLLANWG
ncbi:MAG: dockerin type I domain-containing protein [Planctomycetota bacterium]|nr:dockerin type I domain-containing protein [Planctomycetota bacterium]